VNEEQSESAGKNTLIKEMLNSLGFTAEFMIAMKKFVSLFFFTFRLIAVVAAVGVLVLYFQRPQ
jgi:hypothetical protein